MGDEDRVIIDGDTDVAFHEQELTKHDLDWLVQNGVLRRRKSTTSEGEQHLDTVVIDLDTLAQLAFEYDLLDSVASTVEIEVLRWFREANKTTFTTSEITAGISRPKSSVSRALGRLTEKGQLEKVQQGVYRQR